MSLWPGSDKRHAAALEAKLSQPSRLMTPHDFVLALKADTAAAAESELEYYQDPPSKNPPEHLKKFSQWFRQLPAADKAATAKVDGQTITATAQDGSFVFAQPLRVGAGQRLVIG